MSIDLDRLEQLAWAATCGPWHKVSDEELEAGAIGHVVGPLSTRDGGQTFTIPVIADDVREGRDAEFIAAVDPPTVLELIRLAKGGAA